MPCYLYVFAAEDSPVFKIGFSKQPRARLRTMRTARAVSLSLVYRLLDTKSAQMLESSVHGVLHDHRSHNEWFQAPLPVIEGAIKEQLDRLKLQANLVKPAYHGLLK